MDSLRQTKKRKLDVCDSGFCVGLAEKSQTASVMTDSEPSVV